MEVDPTALPGRQVACVRGPPDRLREGASVVLVDGNHTETYREKLSTTHLLDPSVHTEDFPLQIHLGLFRKHPFLIISVPKIS